MSLCFLSDPIIIPAKENTDVVLPAPKSQSGSFCSDKLWFKYSEKDTYPHLAHMKAGEAVKYFGEYCAKSSSPCAVSPKLKMNDVRGDLTIKSLEAKDEGDYYFKCESPHDWPRHELIKSEVYDKLCRIT